MSNNIVVLAAKHKCPGAKVSGRMISGDCFHSHNAAVEIGSCAFFTKTHESTAPDGCRDGLQEINDGFT